MDLKLLNNQGLTTTFNVPDALFGQKPNNSLIHQTIVAFQANARGGNRSQKDRAHVKHSTKKPWRQKGSGRARAGMSSSPLWRGGGRIFPSSPKENFCHKINKKMYRAGIRSILSQLALEERIALTESFTVESSKSKQVATKLKDLGLDSVLIITDSVCENLYRATRNLQSVTLSKPSNINPLLLLHHRKTLITKLSLKHLEEILG